MRGRAYGGGGYKCIRNAYRVLVGKPERKILLRRPRRRSVGNIKIYLPVIGWEREVEIMLY
jgi:hypothetical protein